jgi:hypothetical protein
VSVLNLLVQFAPVVLSEMLMTVGPVDAYADEGKELPPEGPALTIVSSGCVWASVATFELVASSIPAKV